MVYSCCGTKDLISVSHNINFCLYEAWWTRNEAVGTLCELNGILPGTIVRAWYIILAGFALRSRYNIDIHSARPGK